jgi:hypothetical protein
MVFEREKHAEIATRMLSLPTPQAMISARRVTCRSEKWNFRAEIKRTENLPTLTR